MNIHPNLVWPMVALTTNECLLLEEVKELFKTRRDIGFICYALNELIWSHSSDNRIKLKINLKAALLSSFNYNVDSLGLHLTEQGYGDYTVGQLTYEEMTQLREIWIDKLLEYNK